MKRTGDAAHIFTRNVNDNNDREEFSSSLCLSHLKRRRSQNSDDPCPSSCFSHHPLASSCSSNVSCGNSKQKLKIKDLQEVSSRGEMEVTATFNKEETTERKGTTSLTEVQVGVVELDQTTAPPSVAASRNRSTEAKMPSEDELEEFFSSAERDIQKQFSKKYNFDFEKEEPLEGRFKWIQVNP